MMMKSILVVTAAFVSVSAAHAADEDMLQILESSKAPLQKTEKTAPVDKQRKALFALIGTQTGDAQIFADRFLAGDFKGALLSFNDAFDNTSFKNSANGRALYGYLLSQNGLHLKGLETLLAIETPRQTSEYVISLWKPLLKATSPEWQVVERDVSPEWAERLDIPTLKVAQAKWQNAIDLGISNQADKAAKVLSNLLASGEKVVNADLMNLTAARLLYQNGYLDAAIRYDLKVARGSDYWYEAQEEAAWAYMRKGQVSDSLAITKSLMHPDLTLEVGPESVFLHSLANLKVCNYPEVATALTNFKTRYRAKAQALQGLLTEAGADTINQLLEVAKTESITAVRVGGLAKTMPRNVGRDQIVAERGLRYGLLMQEAARAGELYSQSLQKGSQVGFQGTFEKFRQQLEARAQSTKAGFVNRVQELARTEVKEISDMLQKMHIVEAELIQQTSFSDRVAKDTAKEKNNVSKTAANSAKDQISFPGDNEVWFDELNHYKFDVSRGCQGKKTL